MGRPPHTQRAYHCPLFCGRAKAIENLEADRDAIARQMEEMEEEHGGEEGLMADAKNDKDKINKASVQKRLKELEKDMPQQSF